MERCTGQNIQHARGSYETHIPFLELENLKAGDPWSRLNHLEKRFFASAGNSATIAQSSIVLPNRYTD
jgi:hypothetical protein